MTSAAGIAPPAEAPPPARSAWRLILRNRLAAAGLVVLASIILLALVTPLLPLHPPNATAPANRLLPPFSDGHLLGTDHLGRDILARLMWGTRLSLAVGISATFIAALIGSVIGILAGYTGGRTDNTMMRGIDMLMAFPYILLALAIVAVLGPGLFNALIAVAIVNIPFFARNIRGATVGIVHREFIDAARLSGKGRLRILAADVLPNVLPVIVITMSTTVGWMILETAGLSFLGLGSQPPQADLGSMLGEGRRLLMNAPHVSYLPGLVIFLIVMSINLLGDGVRDALDPRLRAGALARPAPMTAIDRTDMGTDVAPVDAPLSVDHLTTQFRLGSDTHHAVNEVSLSLGRGECLGVIGESGSGKSVTALSLAALVASPPGVIAGGRVLLHGSDLLSKSARELRKVRGRDVAYIFQDPLSTLHPQFTVGDQLVEAIRAHRHMSRAAAWAEAVRLLDLVRIPNPRGRARAYPHELSGGMRQRVGIAMALANAPEIIVADEPTTALDVTVQAQVLDLMDELRRDRDTAVLFITHDFGVVTQICDRVAVMYAGRIVETGPTRQVLEDPAHPYTRKLIDCVPVLGSGRRRFDAISGLPPAANRLPRGCAFAERCELADAACRAGPIAMHEIAAGRQARCVRPLAGTS